MNTQEMYCVMNVFYLCSDCYFLLHVVRKNVCIILVMWWHLNRYVSFFLMWMPLRFICLPWHFCDHRTTKIPPPIMTLALNILQFGWVCKKVFIFYCRYMGYIVGKCVGHGCIMDIPILRHIINKQS